MSEKSVRVQLAPLLHRLFIFTVVLGLSAGTLAASAPNLEPNLKNITRTSNVLEVNPRFVGNGSHIVYLEFTGDPLYPAPWHYRLVLSDRNGHTAMPLTDSGVIDYTVLPGGRELRYLVIGSFTGEDALDDDFYRQITDWQLWHLDLPSQKKQLVERSGGRPLLDGYGLLGVSGLPDFDSDTMESDSPHRTHRLGLSRKTVGGIDFIEFRLLEDDGEKLIWSTEGYKTHTHVNWLPPVVWLSETTFLTLGFDSFSSRAFPQTEGVFSIVRINLTNETKTVLYRSERLKPFPRFSLDLTSSTLYFQQTGRDDSSELWRLNFKSGNSDILYRTRAALGEARATFDGASVVLTRLQNNDFDIVRLDLEKNKTQRLTGN
ncbi:MAG: hypothetical protein ACE5IY_22445 [bacterium]